MSSNTALRTELNDDQRRLAQRETDIRSLEAALADLKKNMAAELSSKSIALDEMRQAYENQVRSHQLTKDILNQRAEELDGVNSMN